MCSIKNLLCILFFPLFCQGQSTGDPGFGSKINYKIYGALLAGDESNSWGAGVNAWYFIHEYWGVGPSLSYSDYSEFFGEKLLNTGAEGIYLKSLTQSFKVFGSMDVGYNHVLINEDEFNLAMAKGGFYLNPQLGIFLVSPRNIAFSLGIGYIRQPWSFTSFDFGTFSSSVQTVYNRYELSFGIVF